MKSPDIHQYLVGETLPLFEGLVSPAPVAELAKIGEDRIGAHAIARQRAGGPGARSDRHMRAAWRLARALQAAKRGQRAGREMAKLSPGQRHEVGTAICEHLLASLKQQVESERPVSKH